MKLALILAIFLMAVPAFAQPQTARNQQPVVTDDETKVNVYKRFWDNRVPNPATAYGAAREYTQLPTMHLVFRLDRETSGVVVMAPGFVLIGLCVELWLLLTYPVRRFMR